MDDEHRWFLAWCAGDKKAGAALFDRHYEPVARFFHNKVDDAAAADLVQSTFLACTEAKGRFRGDASFRTFLFAIAHNLLFKHYRKARVSAARAAPSAAPGGKARVSAARAAPGAAPGDEEEPDFSGLSAADITPSPSSLLRGKEEQRLVLEGLRRIPVECQEVLELHYWERMDTAEIAEIIGAPQGTVKSRLQRGRRLLGEKLSALASSAELLESTMSNLDGWAQGLRERLSMPDGGGATETR